MEKKAKKSRLGRIPSWGWSIIVFVVSIISAFVFEHVKIPGYSTLGIIGAIFYVVLIPLACFVICIIYPKSGWYTPFLCNPVASLGTIFHPLVWTTLPDYLFWVISLGLSVLGAIVGAKIGRRRLIRQKN